MQKKLQPGEIPSRGAINNIVLPCDIINRAFPWRSPYNVKNKNKLIFKQIWDSVTASLGGGTVKSKCFLG
jgi:hypothetical protein